MSSSASSVTRLDDSTFSHVDITWDDHGGLRLHVLLFPGPLVELLLPQGNLVGLHVASLGVLGHTRKPRVRRETDDAFRFPGAFEDLQLQWVPVTSPVSALKPPIHIERAELSTTDGRRHFLWDGNVSNSFSRAEEHTARGFITPGSPAPKAHASFSTW